MGIPSYFSHIIKNYPQIIKKYNYYVQNNVDFHSLFMDCNSIIYDIVNAMDEETRNDPNIENIIINLTLEKILEYILFIKPTNCVYIAFDGVAPFAKMNQQKTRRYKSQFMDIFLNGQSTNKWNTSNITPGTQFMKNLSIKLNEYFSDKSIQNKTKVKEWIISASDESGEGEHKLFQFIRKYPRKDENIVVYGLDSDLIMLSIFHYHLYNNCYIFREAPEFLKSSINIIGNSNAATLRVAELESRLVSRDDKASTGGISGTNDKSNDSDSNFVMDIGLLRNSILSEMKFNEEQRIYDYVFLCFLLGNDFLPHFPALNIRTHGIVTLLEIYSTVFRKNPEKFLTKGNNTEQPKIEWKNVKLYVKELMKHEQQYIIEEYSSRDKFDHWKWNDEINEKTTKEQRDKILQNLPIIYRKEEKYISPSENGWEERYYKSLFHNSNHDIKQQICTNYLEGLEWVYMYYSGKGFDWRWSYAYSYPPLIKDLYMNIPNNNDVKFINQKRDFYPQHLQLAYVLPKSQSKLLPKTVLEIVDKKYPQLYSEEPYEFQWAFCRYFWESHVCFSEINMDILEKNIE